jgi:integrase
MFGRFFCRTTIAKWRDAYLRHCATVNVASTQDAKDRGFRVLTKTFPETERVTRITKERALIFLSHVATERSGGSANDTKRRLRAAWNWGIEFLDMPEGNPFCIRKFPQDEHPRYVPPLADFQAVLALTSGADYAMLLTALHTAARRGEIFRLTWADVDFQRSIIRLSTRKRAGGGMQYDWLPMTATLAEALREQQKKAESEMVFPRPHGGQYKTRSNFFKKLCARAGARRFGFHGIRHLAASLMAEKMPITGVQAILRHTSPLTTARYLHRLGVLEHDLDLVFAEPP